MRTSYLPKFVTGLATAAVLVLASGMPAPSVAAPLDQGFGAPGAEAPPEVAPSSRGRELHAIPPARAAGSGSMADVDRNGLSDGLEARLAALGPNDQVDVIVTATRPGAALAARGAVGNFAVTHTYSRINAFVATISAAQARALASAPGIFRVEENVTYSANLEVARRDFGVERVHTESLTSWPQPATGAGVGICIVDTGVDAGHEQFVDESTGQSKIAGFIDLVGDINGVIQTAPYDDNGHGSNVSNIAAGDGTGPSGFATRLRGVAPESPLYVAKVLNFLGSGPDAGVMQAVEWCADQPEVAVINLSLTSGSTSDGQDALSQLVNAVVADGIVVVVGAGNSGAAPGTIASPAAAARAVTVGAVAEWSGNPNDLWFSGGVYPAPFSSRGPTKDGRIKPDIMAPGVSIAGAYVENIWTGPFPCFDPCYAIVSGTSMSSPFVAGTVALMLQSAAWALAPDDVRRILYTTAQDRFPSAGKDMETGFGLLDAYAAVSAARGSVAAAPTVFPEDMSGQEFVPDNGEVVIPVQVLDPTKPLAITLTLNGKSTRQGWSPDLDAELLDANGNPLLVPGVPPEWDFRLAGSVSTCPAGPECGAAGRQETLYAAPPHSSSYQVRVYAFAGRPNNGDGGSFTFELSNGLTAAGAPVSDPQGGLVANAGADLTVPDDDGDGFSTVSLDGTNSTGSIANYFWSAGAAAGAIPDGMFSAVTLPLGTHTVTLTVSDDLGSLSSDTVQITVGAQKKGGGGPGGGGKGGGKGAPSG